MKKLYLFAFIVGLLGAGTALAFDDWARPARAQPLPRTQTQTIKPAPEPNYPPPAVITPAPGGQTPVPMTPPGTLNVNLPPVPPAPPPEPPAFLVQLITYGLTALLGALGFTAGIPAVPAIARWAAGLLFDVEEKYRGRLKEMIGTALTAGAADMPKTPDGMVPADRKQDLLQRVLNYVQTHGLATLKYLGAKPDSHTATDAILAQAESMLADPKFPVTIARDVIAGGTRGGAPSKDEIEDMFKHFLQEHGLGGTKAVGAS